MNTEELLSSKGYVWYGKCCGGWNKWTPANNLSNGHPLSHERVVRIKGNKIKVLVNHNGRMRYFIKPIGELPNHL